jgi:hypothetical protein
MKEDQDFLSSSNTEPHLITQAESKHLIQDLDLQKTKAQLLGLLRQQWNLLEQSVKVSFFRKRQSSIANYFSFNMPLNSGDSS